jgi:serine/threonine protein phosphatase PrpC
MKVKIEHMMDAGCSGRKNQDAYWVKRQIIRDQEVVMAMVCDGVGGVSNGEVASRRTIDYVVACFWAELPNFLDYHFSIEKMEEQLNIILNKANQRLYIGSKKRGRRTGTTIAFCLIVGSKYLIANVGDSRVYWHKMKGIYRTRDHTAAAIRKDGADAEDEHILWQSIGSQKQLQVDCYTGDVELPMDVLLVTDGAYRSFQKQEMFDFCKNGNLRKMRREAIRRREPDNMTGVRIQIR